MSRSIYARSRLIRTQDTFSQREVSPDRISKARSVHFPAEQMRPERLPSSLAFSLQNGETGSLGLIAAAKVAP